MTADLRRALEQWAKVPNRDAEMQFKRSRALPAGPCGDARSGVTADEAKAFADQAVAALAEAVKLGWGLPSELTDRSRSL